MYNKGDYIILNDKINNKSWNCDKPYGVITALEDIYYMVKIFYPNREISLFEFIFIDDDGYDVYWVNDQYFVRKMTEQEIENLNIMLNSDKYNL